ncbi:unnamed protein product [Timema podura]|uniref:Spaetzle domain-containing protein n=1 Tax=Timema podura TaxID=61482 RepID=A0ABN7NLT7_TIMPD|nr:unnamed protein product [Timema podura]
MPSRPQPHHNGALHMSHSTNQVPDRQTTFEGTPQYRINSAVQHSNTGRNTETRCSGHVIDHINKVAERVQNSRASRQTNSRNSASIAEQNIPSLWSTRSVDDCNPERNIAQRQVEKVHTSIQIEQQQRTPSFPPRSRLPTHDRSRNNSQAQHSSSESVNHRIEQSTRAVPSNLSQDKSVCTALSFPYTGPPRLDEGIVFPDSKQFIPTVANGEPSCANGTTFCFSDQIDSELDIKMRFGEEQELCRYREEVVFPKVGMTKDKRWMFIANTEEIKQGVRVEICEDSLSAYVTSCRQKYVIRKMLSLEGDGSPTQDDFWFPSCCACHVVLSTEVESRMLSSGGPKLGK